VVAAPNGREKPSLIPRMSFELGLRFLRSAMLPSYKKIVALMC
jgi:hypothetical protein